MESLEQLIKEKINNVNERALAEELMQLHECVSKLKTSIVSTQDIKELETLLNAVKCKQEYYKSLSEKNNDMIKAIMDNQKIKRVIISELNDMLS